jgi:hypothetical protein
MHHSPARGSAAGYTDGESSPPRSRAIPGRQWLACAARTGWTTGSADGGVCLVSPLPTATRLGETWGWANLGVATEMLMGWTAAATGDDDSRGEVPPQWSGEGVIGFSTF